MQKNLMQKQNTFPLVPIGDFKTLPITLLKRIEATSSSYLFTLFRHSFKAMKVRVFYCIATSPSYEVNIVSLNFLKITVELQK